MTAPEPVAEETTTDNKTVSFNGGTTSFDTDANQIRIKFDRIPKEDVREVLKRYGGFRWNKETKEWYAPITEQSLDVIRGKFTPRDWDASSIGINVEGLKEEAETARVEQQTQAEASAKEAGISDVFSGSKDDDSYRGSYVLHGGKENIAAYDKAWSETPTPPDDEEFLEKVHIGGEICFVGMPWYSGTKGTAERDFAERRAKAMVKDFYRGVDGARARKAYAVNKNGVERDAQGVAIIKEDDELVLLNQKRIGMREIKPGNWSFAKGGGLAYFYDENEGARRARVKFGGTSYNADTTGKLRSYGWKFDQATKTWTSPPVKTGMELELNVRTPLQAIGLLPYFFDYTGHCENEPGATQDDRPTQYARMTSEEVARMISRAVDRYYSKSV